MLRWAIWLLAFSLLFFGCATKMTHPTLPPLPPYEAAPVSDISLSEEVELANGSEVSQGVEEEEGIAEEKKEEVVEEKEEEIIEEKEVKGPPPEVEKIEVAHLPPSPPASPLVTPEKLLLPDLSIAELFLGPKKRLAVTIANLGEGPLPMGLGNLKIFVDGQLKGSYPLSSLSDRPFLQPKENITFTTSLTFRGQREVEAHVEAGDEMTELNQENNHLRRVLEGLPIGPDITIKDLDLTEDMELSIVLSNVGEVDLRKGVTLRTRVFVNGIKVSEFDHFTSSVLKAHSANQYSIDPPYRVAISGTAQVKVSVLPRAPLDDVRLENNILERTFIIFPFQVVPQARLEFSFSVPSIRPKEEGETDKIKAEARWEGSGSPLMLSFRGPEPFKGLPSLLGRSPLKVEFPLLLEDAQRETLWRVSVINPLEKRVDGHLIIQHP